MLFLKKILSHLFDVKLASSSTPYNPKLDLSLRNGRFYLTTTNAVYSYGDLYDNFSKAFKKLDFSKHQPKDILVLGFGMGSVPFMLEKSFLKQFNCTGVELDGQIIEWAKNYVLPTIDSPVSLIHSDALAYMAANTQQFDLVIVDLFLDDLVPDQFETATFLIQLNAAIRSNGLLLFNRLADTADSLTKTEDFFQKVFLPVFPDGNYMEVGGNWIIASQPCWK